MKKKTTKILKKYFGVCVYNIFLYVRLYVTQNRTSDQKINNIIGWVQIEKKIKILETSIYSLLLHPMHELRIDLTLM